MRGSVVWNRSLRACAEALSLSIRSPGHLYVCCVAVYVFEREREKTRDWEAIERVCVCVCVCVCLCVCVCQVPGRERSRGELRHGWGEGRASLRCCGRVARELPRRKSPG
jgi:hypothetical protein